MVGYDLAKIFIVSSFSGFYVQKDKSKK